MSDLHNWKVAVDECHQKHIGPPPAQHRRLAYLEAHSEGVRAVSSASFFKRLLKFWARGREV